MPQEEFEDKFNIALLDKFMKFPRDCLKLPEETRVLQKLGISLPSLEVVGNPEEGSTTAAWVYNADDKWSSGLYPLGFESHQEAAESVRRPPIRHSSFAGPRYARVHPRPQRAHSFILQRDPFSLHNAYYSKIHPVSVPTLPIMRRRGTIRRSSSLSAGDKVTTLSSKYRAFSLGRQNDGHILEVGSLVSTISEHSLADALVDPGTVISRPRTPEETISAKSTIEKVKLEETRFSRPIKGPAPLPPKKIDFSKEKNHYDIPDVKIKRPHIINSKNNRLKPTYEESLPDSEDFCTCKSENEEEVKVDSLVPHKGSSMEDLCSCSSKDFSQNSDSDCRDPGSPSTENDSVPNFSETGVMTSTPKKLDHKEFMKALKSHLTSNKLSDPDQWNKLEHLLTEILDGNNKDPEPVKAEPKIHKSQSHRTVLRSPRNTRSLREAFSNPSKVKTLFERLPSDEVQKNKIVLRVPSFKDNGCQTEFYRPLRRRATLSQASQIPLPRGNEKIIWAQDVQVSNVASSSSGYSSPDGESKGDSPLHSGPPSPSTTLGNPDFTGPNVTIIEVNRSDPPLFPHEHLFIPTRPQKPTRHLPNRSSSLHTINFGKREDLKQNLPAIKESNVGADKTVTETVNPYMNNIQIPRIVDVIRKGSDASSFEQTKLSPLRTNSLSLPRIPSLRRPKDNFQNELRVSLEKPEHPTLRGTVSTAAYLASLQLLASHYRQQAIENAKQLQRQQLVLDQKLNNQHTTQDMKHIEEDEKKSEC